MNSTKQCPYCGGTILAVAKKCKHCKKWIDDVEMEPCPVCMELIPKSQDVCPYCHENVKQFSKEIQRPMHHCPVCNEMIPEDVSICPYCNENVKVFERFFIDSAQLVCDEPVPLDAETRPNCQDNLQENTQEQPNSHNERKIKTWWNNLFYFDKELLFYAVILIIALLSFVAVKSFTKQNNTYSDETLIDQKKVDEEAVCQILTRWTDCHNNRDLEGMKDLYASSVKYYQTQYSLDEVIRSKQKMLKKYPVFVQYLEYVHVIFPHQDLAYVEFNKRVGVEAGTDYFANYPSYLILSRKSLKWLIIEESDYITDATLERKKSKSI